jgi:hypothetical protein
MVANSRLLLKMASSLCPEQEFLVQFLVVDNLKALPIHEMQL